MATCCCYSFSSQLLLHFFLQFFICMLKENQNYINSLKTFFHYLSQPPPLFAHKNSMTDITTTWLMLNILINCMMGLQVFYIKLNIHNIFFSNSVNVSFNWQFVKIHVAAVMKDVDCSSIIFSFFFISSVKEKNDLLWLNIYVKY